MKAIEIPGFNSMSFEEKFSLFEDIRKHLFREKKRSNQLQQVFISKSDLEEEKQIDLEAEYEKMDEAAKQFVREFSGILENHNIDELREDRIQYLEEKYK